MSAAHRRTVLVLMIVFVVTASYRFLTLRSFTNDHFVHMTPGWQMLSGEWPILDFQDPGHPLMSVVSALGQALMGPTLLSDAVLVVVALGAAAALTVLLVHAMTGSMLLGVTAAAFEVAIFPRSYSYPKILVYAVVFLIFQRYVARPTTARRVAMAVGVAIAFMFRHDHGLFLGAGGALIVALTPPLEGVSRQLRKAIVFGLMAGAMVLPFLIYVEVSEGVWAYFRTGIEFSRREASHSGRIWPGFSEAERPYAVLVYLFHALPLLAAVVAFRRPASDDRDRTLALVLPIALVAVLVNLTFLRDPLLTRMADPVVPAVVLGAWLMKEAQTSPRKRVVLPMALAVAASAAWATLVVGATPDEIERMGLNGLLSVPERFAQRRDQLRARFDPQQMPTRAIAAMVPFFDYVDRCTSPDDRLLTAGFLPEVPYYARRRFAGGQIIFMAGYFESKDNQRQVVERLQHQSVPFVVVPSNYAADLLDDFPLVDAYVVAHYTPLVTINVDEDLDISILVDRTRPQVSRDAGTGWPCFR
jgi:hypothetical protein